MEKILKRLKELGKSVSTMESCSGGAVASAITDIPGASEVFHYSAVTYSNFFKIKMGVSEEVIQKYSVYSIETAIEMSKAISSFTSSDYGIGITGKLGNIDKENPYGDDNLVFISIYDRKLDICYQASLSVTSKERHICKQEIVDKVKTLFLTILKN